MGDQKGGDPVMQMIAQILETQRRQVELMEAKMEKQNEAMEKQNEAIQALLSERSDTRSEMSGGTRHRGPSIDALEKQIRNFSYNPTDGVTFNTWIDRHRDIFENDLKEMDDSDKGRLLLRHVDDKVYQQLVDHIRPKRPSELTYEEVVEIMLDLFGDKKSEFEKRLDVFSLKMSKLRCNDIKEFSGIVNRVVEQANIKDMPLDQFKAIVMLAGMDLPRHTATMFHVMNQIRSDEKPTIQSILSVVDVYKEVYGDAQLVSNQNNVQVNAVRNNGRYRDHRQNGTTSNLEKRCESCDRYHKRADCPHSNSECYKCHSIGHIASVCKKENEPEMKEIGQERKINVIVKEGASRDSTFDVEMQLNGITITMISDTGSDLTIISEESWKKVGKPERLKANERVVCANNESLILTGMCHVDMEMNGVKIRREVFITEAKLNVLGKDNFREFFRLIPRTAEIRKPESHRDLDHFPRTSCQDEALRRNLWADETCGVVLNMKSSVRAAAQDKGPLEKDQRAAAQDKGPLEKDQRAAAQDKGPLEKDQRAAAQDKGPLEKDKRAAAQDKGPLEKDQRAAAQDKGPLEKDQRAAAQDKGPLVKPCASGSTGNYESSTESGGQDKASCRDPMMSELDPNGSAPLMSDKLSPRTVKLKDAPVMVNRNELKEGLHNPDREIESVEEQGLLGVNDDEIVHHERTDVDSVDENETKKDATTVTATTEAESIDDGSEDEYNDAPRRSTRVRTKPKRLKVNFKNEKYDEE